MSDLTSLIQVRTRHFETLFGQALRVEIALYLSRQIEGRVVRRPHWMRRTPKIMFEEMRKQTDLRTEALVGELTGRINQVREELGLTPSSADRAQAEENAVLDAMAPVLEDAARDLLLAFFVPGDEFPDLADDNRADVAPRFDLGYEPTLGLVWAWTQLRMMDVARLAWQARGRGEVPPSFELRMFLPEALADD